MLTTVIVPTFNRAGLLARAIESLWRQRDAADLDLLIVDDGSTDETPAIAADLARRMPIVRVVRQENSGVAGARNCGLRHLKAETEIVTFLDSDDVCPPGRFAADQAALEANPSIELTYGLMRLVRAFDPETLMPVAEDARAAFCGIHLSCALMRRGLIERIGAFDTAFRQSEDTDYLLRIFETGTRFLQTRTTTLYYLRHGGNMTADVATASRFFAMALYRSVQRRRADASRVLRTPDFSLAPLRAPEAARC